VFGLKSGFLSILNPNLTIMNVSRHVLTHRYNFVAINIFMSKLFLITIFVLCSCKFYLNLTRP
jgi:hypothetical protein